MIKSSDTNGQFQASDLENYYTYVIDYKDESNRARTVIASSVDGEEITETKLSQGQGATATWEHCIGFKKDGDLVRVYDIAFEEDAPTNRVRTESKGSYGQINLVGESKFCIYKYNGNIPTGDHVFNTLRSDIRSSFKLPFGDIPGAYTVSSFNDLDRTKSTLIKVIKFPYCPVDYTLDANGNYVFDSKIQLSSNSLKLGGRFLLIPDTVEFGRTLKTDIDNPLARSNEVVLVTPHTYDLKDVKYESKLLNSEFYQPRIVYDSFVKEFDLEKVHSIYGLDPKLQIKYKPSRVFNSNFMFKFPEYQTDEMDDENYNNILICSRNNEVPIYSSSYLNYVRNGYNYDVKAKNLGIAQNVAGLGVQAALSALGLGAMIGQKPYINDFEPSKLDLRKMSFPERNAALRDTINKWDLAYHRYSNKLSTAATTVGLGVAAGISNVVIQDIQAENALKQKINSLKESTISVNTNDDTDLLQDYSGNKAKLMEYKPSNKAKFDLFDLFYYTGYATNNIEMPNFNSRYWFNYIQCEPVFKQRFNTYDNFMADMKLRYAQGVTIYHEHFGE